MDVTIAWNYSLQNVCYFPCVFTRISSRSWRLIRLTLHYTRDKWKWGTITGNWLLLVWPTNRFLPASSTANPHSNFMKSFPRNFPNTFVFTNATSECAPLPPGSVSSDCPLSKTFNFQKRACLFGNYWIISLLPPSKISQTKHPS